MADIEEFTEEFHNVVWLLELRKDYVIAVGDKLNLENRGSYRKTNSENY